MFADARSVPRDTTLEADVCVVGGGAAGITLARELSGSPYRVAVLESGGLEYEIDTQSLYQGRSIGLPYSELSGPRLRFFVGTNNHLGAIYMSCEYACIVTTESIRITCCHVEKCYVDTFNTLAARVVAHPFQVRCLAYWATGDELANYQ